MSGSLTIHKHKMVQFTGLLYPRQPAFDNNVRTAMEYLAYSLLGRPVSRFLNEQSFSYYFGELPNLDRFHDDFVSLKNDRFHRAFHVGKAAQQHRQCIGLGRSHGRRDSEAIS